MIKPRPIKLIKADIVRFWSKVNKRGCNDCWEWQNCCDKSGYGHFCDCHYSSYRAHRVAYAVTYGDTELLVCHKCNNPACCNPKHLYAGTYRDNNQQCRAEDRAVNVCGENHGRAKLTKSKVREIRALYVDGWLQREIAKEYGISQMLVSYICRGKKWKHV